MRFDSIIFDLDGTIWDAAESCTRAWNEVLKQNSHYGIMLKTSDLRAVMGKTLDVIEDIIFKNVSSKAERHAIRTKCTKYQMGYLAEHGGCLYPNVEEVLSTLSKKYKLAIVSNCEHGYLDAFFEAHSLKKYFTDYEYWENTLLPKEENIRLVMERNGFKSSVYVGDTPSDALAASKAGLPFIHAAYGFGRVEENKLCEINKFEELKTVL